MTSPITPEKLRELADRNDAGGPSSLYMRRGEIANSLRAAADRIAALEEIETRHAESIRTNMLKVVDLFTEQERAKKAEQGRDALQSHLAKTREALRTHGIDRPGTQNHCRTCGGCWPTGSPESHTLVNGERCVAELEKGIK